MAVHQLTRCLPFEEWEYVDWSTGDFEEKLYMENDDEPLTAEEEGYKEYWWEGFGQERIHVWGDDMAKLHALIPPSSLPEDFAGTAPWSNEPFFSSLH